MSAENFPERLVVWTRWKRARSWLRGAGAFVALTVALVLARRGEVGLWDWDTYGRLKFIHHYQPDRFLDGHVLYHYLMRGLMNVGLRDVTAVVVVTALGAAAFLWLLAWICRREGLSLPATALVLVAATFGSPGLVELYLLTEDNVLYLPVVLGIFYVAFQAGGERRAVLRRGVWLGLLFAVGILINVSLLVLLFALAVAPLLAKREPLRARGLVVAGGTALVAYYAAHVFPFTGAKAALHEFLPQALRLADFQQSNTSLFSMARLDQYLGGLRATALTPSVHLMRLPPGLYALLTGALPHVLAALALCLAGWVLLFRGGSLRAALWVRLDLLALFGVAVVFPYFYEPALIERWDVLWVGCLFALVPFLRSKPSNFAVGLVALMIALQAVGTTVAVAHHYGKAWADPAFVQMRAAAGEVRERHSDPLVLPFWVDRLLLADLTNQVPGRTIYLVRDDGAELACFRIVDLMERPVSPREVRRALRVGAHVYVDPALSPHTLGLLGREP
jgi:hypothetical protein